MKNITENETVDILIAGDLCTRLEAEEAILQGKSKDMIEDKMKALLMDKDLSIVNVEMALTNSENGIIKSGPCIKCKPECAKFVKECGFDIACLANNHIGDYGPEAVMETISHLKKLDIATVGAGEDLNDANKILYIEKKGFKIAILNYAEHEFGTATRTEAGSAPLDVFNVIESIKTAKQNADVVIVILHGGNEYNPVPSPRMVKWYRGFADAGASVVINIHPHCPQGFEVYKGTPIIYSLGNFVFPRLHSKDDMWTKGYMVKLKISKNAEIQFDTIPYTYENNKATLMQGQELEEFNQYLKCLSDIISNEQELEKYWLAWCKKHGEEWAKQYLGHFDIKNGREDIYVLYMRNAFSCEAHNEVFTTYFRAFCDNNLNGLEQYTLNIEKLQRGFVI